MVPPLPPATTTTMKTTAINDNIVDRLIRTERMDTRITTSRYGGAGGGGGGSLGVIAPPSPIQTTDLPYGRASIPSTSPSPSCDDRTNVTVESGTGTGLGPIDDICQMTCCNEKQRQQPQKGPIVISEDDADDNVLSRNLLFLTCTTTSTHTKVNEPASCRQHYQQDDHFGLAQKVQEIYLQQQLPLQEKEKEEKQHLPAHQQSVSTSDRPKQKHQLHQQQDVQFSSPKNVRFSYVTIRNYDITMSDNPAVTAGPPIQLDWDYEQLPIIPIREFEHFRVPRRMKQSNRLFISPEFRRGILLRAGFSDDQIDSNQRAIAKVQKNRSLTCLSFPFYRVEYAVRSAGRKIQRTTGKSFSRGGGGKKTKVKNKNKEDCHSCAGTSKCGQSVASEAFTETFVGDSSSDEEDSTKRKQQEKQQNVVVVDLHSAESIQ
eukprot:CAMPEP_0113460756 /NCGR_PEP_ID=MMETSP0014_2-20120614/11162_1 /TAXON_ID=2857 /ORGANISM="Nitzschia sp." /LENGTH=430 /DNA_ID=CAMNT_0000352441 /DNA_START=303 /DNA_END=1595 /DNA_ORIENTATION=- /assembly_acc=CAM_ASM_000159